MDLDQVLGQFDTVEANLGRLEGVWKEMRALIPEGISSLTGTPEAVEYESLRRAYADILTGLPPVDGWRIEAAPLGLGEIAQERLDALEVGVYSARVDTEKAIFGPDEAIEEYRFRFRRARSKLVRDRAAELVKEIDGLVGGLIARVPTDGRPSDDEDWSRLVEAVAEIERLVGPAVRSMGRWRDLARHLAFAQWVDLRDIANHDWPSVRPQIEAALYTEREPLPVEVGDLGEIAGSRPGGKVSTALAWGRLDPEGFERLVFNLIDNAAGYENARWLTRTDAPDKGRDLSVERARVDSLSGVVRQRVIIQCKHLQATSMGLGDVSQAATAMTLWEPPPVDVLIIATSGRFTTTAVDWIERHNLANQRPQIEMWPESHLESLLAERPAVVAEFRLRAT